MGKLEDDYPEFSRITPTVRYYRPGEEPDGWEQWRHTTPQQRLRVVEYLRRSYYGYDPNAINLSEDES
jgi:hypothetical protein